MSSNYTPSSQEIQSARELGFVTQLALNDVPTSQHLDAVNSYREHFNQREARLDGMHSAIIEGRGK
jgi:hypothetical protein